MLAISIPGKELTVPIEVKAELTPEAILYKTLGIKIMHEAIPHA
jgi:hypothetical protein